MKKEELNCIQTDFMDSELSNELNQLVQDHALENNESLWWVLFGSNWVAAGPG